MPSNHQRREAAKRKLQRQIVRREQRERGRRQRLLVIGVIAAVLVIAGGVWFFTTRGGTDTASTDNTSSTAGTSAAESSAPATPCRYPEGGVAAKAVTPPSNTSPANSGTVDVDISLNGETVTATLDRKAAPCTVNSFVSLASQGFYDNTDCFRLTKSEALNILQCGDPTGEGNGGPGYTFADENTENTKYPVGSLAMANAGTSSTGAGTNGSQFFIVYANTVPTGSYTVFGKVSDSGMKVVQAIAAKGVAKGQQSGKPVSQASIEKITVPTDAVTATGNWPTTTASAPQPSAPEQSGPEPSVPESTPSESGPQPTRSGATQSTPTATSSESAAPTQTPVSQTTTN